MEEICPLSTAPKKRERHLQGLAFRPPCLRQFARAASPYNCAPYRPSLSLSTGRSVWPYRCAAQCPRQSGLQTIIAIPCHPVPIKSKPTAKPATALSTDAVIANGATATDPPANDAVVMNRSWSRQLAPPRICGPHVFDFVPVLPREAQALTQYAFGAAIAPFRQPLVGRQEAAAALFSEE